MWLKVANLHALNIVIIVSSNLYNMYGGDLGPHVNLRKKKVFLVLTLFLESSSVNMFALKIHK